MAGGQGHGSHVTGLEADRLEKRGIRLLGSVRKQRPCRAMMGRGKKKLE